MRFQFLRWITWLQWNTATTNRQRPWYSIRGIDRPCKRACFRRQVYDSVFNQPTYHLLENFSDTASIRVFGGRKRIKTEIHRLGDFEWESENTETPTCVYPSQSYLQANRNVSGMPIFTRLLAWGEPQLTPCYFDMEVLQRYYDDPRFLFFFKDYSGRISYREKDGTPIVRKEDEAFLQTFGLGYDNTDTRIVVAF